MSTKKAMKAEKVAYEFANLDFRVQLRGIPLGHPNAGPTRRDLYVRLERAICAEIEDFLEIGVDGYHCEMIADDGQLDPELRGMHELLHVLRKLNDGQQKRALDYVCSRLGIKRG